MAQATKTGTGLPKNTAAALSYIGFWVTGIIFLLIEKEPFVRFHAMQSIIVFGILTLIWLFPLFWIFTPLIGIIGIVLWLLLIYKAYQGEKFKLPVIGDFAEKQMGRF
jgi:uncharacterized membrane protein